MSAANDIWPCVGVCMPDEEEAYCLGCGRPWGEPRPLEQSQPSVPEQASVTQEPVSAEPASNESPSDASSNQ